MPTCGTTTRDDLVGIDPKFAGVSTDISNRFFAIMNTLIGCSGVAFFRSVLSRDRNQSAGGKVLGVAVKLFRLAAAPTAAKKEHDAGAFLRCLEPIGKKQIQLQRGTFVWLRKRNALVGKMSQSPAMLFGSTSILGKANDESKNHQRR